MFFVRCCCLLFVVDSCLFALYLLFSVGGASFVVRCLLSVICFFVLCCWLFSVCCLLAVIVCCAFVVSCCGSLFVVPCLLCVDIVTSCWFVLLLLFLLRDVCCLSLLIRCVGVCCVLFVVSLVGDLLSSVMLCCLSS